MLRFLALLGEKIHRTVSKSLFKHALLSDGFYKTGTEYFLFPYNFHGMDYYLTNSTTNLKNGYEMVDVIVSSGGKEVKPYISWNQSENNGIAADAIQIMARDIENKLETIVYDDDFKIKFSSHTTPSYTIYKDNFETYNDNTSPRWELVMPTEPGIYILRIQVHYGIPGDNTCYDYVVKVVVPE